LSRDSKCKHLVERKNGFDRAGRHAGAAINALVGVDVELLLGLEVRLVFPRVDAVHRAHVDARRILRSNARFRNDVSHPLSLSMN
jgi:hypothetical protein